MTVSSLFYLNMKKREKFRRCELLLNQVNWALENRGIYFRLGVNMYWLELHILKFLDENIQVGQLSKFENVDKLHTFKPQGEYKPLKNGAVIQEVEKTHNMETPRITKIVSGLANNETSKANFESIKDLHSDVSLSFELEGQSQELDLEEGESNGMKRKMTFNKLDRI